MILIRAVVFTLLALPVRAEPPLVVGIVIAKATANTQNYTLTGEIVARDTLSAAFPTGGRIAAVLVDKGAAVRKGDVLARVDAVQQQQAVRAAEAGVLTAQADQRQASEELARQEGLLGRGATTRITRDAAEDALNVANGSLAQALAEADRSDKALADTVLMSPADATVTDRMAEPGQVIGAAQPVLTLALGTDLDAVFDVPEVLLTQSEETPPPVILSRLDTPQTEFTGKVREVSPLVDPAKGTVAVTVTVEAQPAATSRPLTYGDAVRGVVSVADAPHVALPFTAISATAAGPAVWVVNPDTMGVSLQPVTVERFTTGVIVLADGISDGTLVVTAGAHLLYPGRVVQAAEAGQ